MGRCGPSPLTAPFQHRVIDIPQRYSLHPGNQEAPIKSALWGAGTRQDAETQPGHTHTPFRPGPVQIQAAPAHSGLAPECLWMSLALTGESQKCKWKMNIEILINTLQHNSEVWASRVWQLTGKKKKKFDLYLCVQDVSIMTLCSYPSGILYSLKLV